MYYVLPTKTMQGSSAVVGLFFKKGVLELNYLKDISQEIWAETMFDSAFCKG